MTHLTQAPAAACAAAYCTRLANGAAIVYKSGRRASDRHERVHARAETLERHRFAADAHLLEHARGQRVDRQVVSDAIDGPLVGLGEVLPRFRETVRGA